MLELTLNRKVSIPLSQFINQIIRVGVDLKS